MINLLAFALAIDALITPAIPQPVRNEYMIAMIGQRFMKREVYSEATVKVKMKRIKTGVIRYGPNGPQELTKLIDEEVMTKEYYRIRRADLRYVGRKLWKAMEKMFLAGGRNGSEWQEMKTKMVVALNL